MSRCYVPPDSCTHIAAARSEQVAHGAGSNGDDCGGESQLKVVGVLEISVDIPEFL